MEKPSRLCDWLLVNKEVNAVWGLWGEGAKQNNNDWIREVASKERDRKKKKRKKENENRPKYITAYCTKSESSLNLQQEAL